MIFTNCRGAMCPLYPLHIALLYLCLALPLLLAVVEGADTLAGWRLSFSQAKLGAGSNETDKLRELTTKQFDLLCTNCVQQPSNKYKLILQNEDPNIASVSYMEYEQVKREYRTMYCLNIEGFFCRTRLV